MIARQPNLDAGTLVRELAGVPSGQRRATMLTIVLIGVGAVAGPVAAVNAAMGAFVVGLFDRQQPTKSLAKMSFFGALLLTAVSLAAGLTDERILLLTALAGRLITWIG